MLQLSIFEHITPHHNPSPLRFPNPRKAEKLRDLADSMNSQIEEKLHPAIANQRSTARRARIARSIREDGEKLQQIQSWLYAMAEAADIGVLPDILSNITTKSQLEPLYSFTHERWSDPEIAKCFHNNPWNWGDKLRRAKLHNLNLVKRALASLQSLHQPAPIDRIQQQIQDLEQDIIGVEFPGYFPTPTDICKQMVELASLSDGMKVLEPSGGKGSLCESITEAASVQLDVCEVQYTLRKLLQLKGFNVIASDFLELEPKPQYQRILMNPPFGRGAQEVHHIHHAYKCLAPFGRIVAIMPESITFRKDLIYREFREWLKDKCYLNEALPDGTFLASDRPTALRTRLLVIEKD
jgi:hypothetical protein